MSTHVVCIGHRFPHHGSHSGYHMLARYVADEYMIEDNWVLRVLEIVPDKWFYRVPGCHPTWYDRSSLALEIQLMLHRLLSKSKKKRIFHFLYGEHSFRWAGRIRQVIGQANRLIATYHQLPQFFEKRRGQFSHVRDLDAVILVSSNQREFFDTMIDPERVHVVPHGVDTRFFRPPTRNKEGCREYYCLTVGSNYRDVGLHVRVIQNINKSFLSGRVKFIIVGEPRLADNFHNLRDTQYITNISDAQLLRCYQIADILLLPLEDMTASNALLEGMACGLPVVVTDVGGVRDYVNDECAAIVPSHDVETMTDRVLSLLEDPGRRHILGRRARERAVRYFDWQYIAQQVRSVYEGLW